MTTQHTRRVTTTRHLVGRGRLKWGDVQAEASGMLCAWADYAGFHVGEECPSVAPPYTHLWAWTPDHSKLMRVRIDGDEGIVGLLWADPPAGVSGKHVEVVSSTGLPWGDDGQLGRTLPPHISAGTFVLYEPLVPLPATFVAVG